MKVKIARVYTLEELKEKSQKALADPKLVEIVKTAPLNNEGKVNCTWAYKEAEKYVHEQTKDLQKTKELSVATRFLAMLRRASQEEFETLVAQEKTPEPKVKPMETKKFFHEIDFNEDGQSGIKIRFVDNSFARRFCMKILKEMIETADTSPSLDIDLLVVLRNDLIQLLEEKFGLQIKVCGNCKRYVWHADKKWGQCFYHVPDGYPGEKVNFSDVCEKDWAPKEVSEKPSSA